MSNAAALTPDVPIEALTREQTHSRRKREVRAVTISTKRMSKRELELGRLLYPEDPGAEPAPRVRADCAGGERPCPYVSCKHHLYLDVNRKTGAIKLNFPDLEVWELDHSCVLDVADGGAVTLERAGELLNLTRERILQVEVRMIDKLRARREVEALRKDATER